MSTPLARQAERVLIGAASDPFADEVVWSVDAVFLVLIHPRLVGCEVRRNLPF